MAFVETSSTPSQWRVFLLCEPADHLPVGLLLFAHQLAWDVVQREGPVYQALDSTDLDLRSFITSTLELVRPKTRFIGYFLLFPLCYLR